VHQRHEKQKELVECWPAYFLFPRSTFHSPARDTKHSYFPALRQFFAGSANEQGHFLRLQPLSHLNRVGR